MYKRQQYFLPVHGEFKQLKRHAETAEHLGYIPSTDTYIEKDSAINDEIDRLRHSATAALSELSLIHIYRAQRQVVEPEFAAGQGQQHGVRRGELGKLGVVAVSYTHLDVYKRQPQCGSGG